MTDHSEALMQESSEQEPAPSVQKRSRFDFFLKWILVIFLVMQLMMRTVWEPAAGPALLNLITASQILLSSVLSLVWWFFFSPFSMKSVLSVGLPVLAVIAAWLGSIQKVDFDGDMAINFRYRWEKSGTEQFKEFQENAVAASTESIEKVEQFSPEDIPAYRGINRDGVVIGPPIRKDWEVNPPAELWRHPCGGGYSSFSVVDPVLITMEQRENDEAVVCYEISTGREFWQHRYPGYFNALGGPGPRSTPTIHNNSVYSFGCYGDLFCLDLKTGEVRWHVNVLQQFQLPTTTWGMTSSPLIYEGKVIVNIGGLKDPEKSMADQTGNALVAYGLEQGELVWYGAGLPAPVDIPKLYLTGSTAIEGIEGVTIPGYSSPMLATLGGMEQILNFDGCALRGHDPATGVQLWKFPFTAGDYINVAQPILLGNDQVLISSGYGTGTSLLSISQENDAWEVSEVWHSTRLRSKFSSPVLHDGYVYGLDEGIMVCIDPQNGKRLWKGRREGLRGRYGHGQMLLVDDHLVVLTETGELVLIEPNPTELRVLGITRVLADDEKTWNPLTIAYGKAFVRNALEVACFDLRDDANSGRSTSSELATTTTGN